MKIAIGLTALLLAACATPAKFESKMNGFVGGPEAAVVSTYGPPQSSYVLADGSRVIQYTRGGQMVIPGATTSTPVTTNTTGTVTVNQGANQTIGVYSAKSTTVVEQPGPSTPVQFACTVNFTVSAAGVVQSWTAHGNHCVAD